MLNAEEQLVWGVHQHRSCFAPVNQLRFVISGFRRDVDEICPLLGYDAALNGNPLPMFRDNLSVQSSRVKKSNKHLGPPDP
jgi:hypothetical protein